MLDARAEIVNGFARSQKAGLAWRAAKARREGGRELMRGSTRRREDIKDLFRTWGVVNSGEKKVICESTVVLQQMKRCVSSGAPAAG